MNMKVPQSHRQLVDGPVFATLVTLMPDGRPQASVVWFNGDDEFIWVNSARGRQKDQNMRARPQVAILAFPPDNPYSYLEIRGDVVEITEAGAVEHINALAKLYRGVDSYYGGVTPAELAEKETRVIYKIKPTRVVAL